jgi:long-chain acyl-CoA synthetase
MKKFRTVFGGNIKYMPCAGSAISPELLKFFHAMGLFVNYGYGATETTATVSCMKYDEYDFNYTGTIMPDTEVKISEQDHMILVKGGIVFQGYYKKPKETEEVLKDGWYYTGDQGEIIGEDTLFMTERIKDIIKTSTGKYISPQKTELALSQSDLIEQLCVIGDNRKYLTALIVPVFPKLESIAKDHGIKYQNIKELVANPVINNMVFEDIKSHQERLAPHERIAKFALLEEIFTIENALMTNSLKVRRKEVNKLYAKKIEDLY